MPCALLSFQLPPSLLVSTLPPLCAPVSSQGAWEPGHPAWHGATRWESGIALQHKGLGPHSVEQAAWQLHPRPGNAVLPMQLVPGIRRTLGTKRAWVPSSSETFPEVYGEWHADASALHLPVEGLALAFWQPLFSTDSKLITWSLCAAAMLPETWRSSWKVHLCPAWKHCCPRSPAMPRAPLLLLLFASHSDTLCVGFIHISSKPSWRNHLMTRKIPLDEC